MATFIWDGPAPRRRKKSTRISRAHRARMNAGQSAYQAYYAERRARGRTPAQARADWKRHKAALARKSQTKRDVVDLAAIEVYHAAERILGHSDFLHAAGMLDADSARKSLRVELPPTRDTKRRKGYSTWGVDTPEFIRELRKIQRKYRPHGLKMTVAVKNPRGRR